MRRLSIGRGYACAAGVIALIVIAVSMSGRQGPLIELYDYGEHVASIRELAARPLEPHNPLLAGGGPTLRYTPYIMLLAALVRFAGLSLPAVVTLASAGSFLLFAAGLYYFSRDYFKDEKMPLYALLVLLFCWGKPFGYSNEYCLRFFCYTAFYPSMVAFGASLAGLSVLLRYVRSGRAAYCGWYALWAAALFATHPLTGSFFFVAALVMVLAESRSVLRHLAGYAAGVALALALALLWPWYSFADAVALSTTAPWYDFKDYLYGSGTIFRAGPALLGIPVLVYLLKKGTNRFVSWGGLACAGVYAAGGLVDVYLLDRYIFFSIFFLHTALAWHLRQIDLLSIGTLKQLPGPFSSGAAARTCWAVVLCCCVLYQAAKLGCEQAGFEVNFTQRPMLQPYTNPADAYRGIRDLVREGDVVLSDPLTAWLVPAFTGAKIVALYHNNPMVDGNERRKEDVRRFYEPQTTLSERRGILRSYGVTHVLLNRDRMRDSFVNRVRNYRRLYALSSPLLEDMSVLGRTVFESSTLILFQTEQ